MVRGRLTTNGFDAFPSPPVPLPPKWTPTMYVFEKTGRKSAVQFLNEAIRKGILHKIPAAFFRTACQGEIDSAFAGGALGEAQIIIITRDANGGSYRGFCCIKKNYRPLPRRRPNVGGLGFLYVDLICSAPTPKGAVRGVRTWWPNSKAVESGRSMLDFVKMYCRARGWKGIFLRAVTKVITYYYKVGKWRLITECSDIPLSERDPKTGLRKRPRGATQSAEVEDNINSLLSLIKTGQDEETIKHVAKQYFGRYGDFAYYQAGGPPWLDILEQRDEAQEDLDEFGRQIFDFHGDENTRKEAYEIPDQGYLMLWCPTDPNGNRFLPEYRPGGLVGPTTARGRAAAAAAGRRATSLQGGGRRRTRKQRGGEIQKLTATDMMRNSSTILGHKINEIINDVNELTKLPPPKVKSATKISGGRRRSKRRKRRKNTKKKRRRTRRGRSRKRKRRRRTRRGRRRRR